MTRRAYIREVLNLGCPLGSPGKFLKALIPRPHSRPLESEPLRTGPRLEEFFKLPWDSNVHLRLRTIILFSSEKESMNAAAMLSAREKKGAQHRLSTDCVSDTAGNPSYTETS